MKYAEKQKVNTDAYLTVYLTLVLTIMLSLCLALIEGTRQNGIYMEAECITDIGINSVLAEYHRELLNQYNLFAIDSSYGTSLPQVQNTQNRIKFYLERNLARDDILLDWLMYRDFMGMQLGNVTIKRARMLTDGEGAVFRRRAAEAMFDNTNLALMEELSNWLEIVESEKMTERDIAAEKKKLDKKLDGYGGQKQISETEWVTITIANPTDYLEKIRNKGILTWVVDDVSKLSSKKIVENNLISSRMKKGKYNKGNLELEQSSEMGTAVERFLFQEYLLHYMGHYGAENQEHALAYQIEYLLMGQNNDLRNLKDVVKLIFATREVANTVYLYSDKGKCAIAEALATVLAAAMGVPDASEVVEGILILGWAFAESLYDVSCLLDGKRIPLMKTASTWHYDLKGALEVGKKTGVDKSEGLSYEDYLRILLMLEKEELLTSRAMDMVEADIRLTEGNETFRLDGCLDAIEVCVNINSVYGYDCEFIRQKGYST